MKKLKLFLPTGYRIAKVWQNNLEYEIDFSRPETIESTLTTSQKERMNFKKINTFELVDRIESILLNSDSLETKVHDTDGQNLNVRSLTGKPIGKLKPGEQVTINGNSKVILLNIGKENLPYPFISIYYQNGQEGYVAAPYLELFREPAKDILAPGLVVDTKRDGKVVDTDTEEIVANLEIHELNRHIYGRSKKYAMEFDTVDLRDKKVATLPKDKKNNQRI